ncbi:peroxisome proliferator-activated receptor gamma coactivator-related protein 1 isoform X2 [Protopterus annectens]|uniref:peroxisome proliferator-activated receptor gamma coactivator-related protein 1 isoform X2 n=1 Tax=Protopterus annectens TaxID=7888 RepID=UPI001CFB0F97|nr:peroxisome proliferator-activated receptor gamma coactivator-related protein 1 isoform X2 [Protopterus annectens]
MAARWGVDREPFIGYDEDLFASGSMDQCGPLTEDVCASLPDLDFMPLDAGGFGSVGGLLGSLHGCIDSSIISIIEDSSSLAECKDHLEEETEVTLLTALTEILDNVDDENLSPFDALPESDFLGSSKDKDGSSLRKLLCLSRTPPEREIPLVDHHVAFRTCASTKVEAPSTGRLSNSFSCSFDRAVTRRQSCARASRKIPVLQVMEMPTQQRSDGEEEEVCSLELNSSSETEDIESDTSADCGQAARGDEMPAQCLPYIIINKERIALNELVRYIHSYSLPPLSVKEDSVKKQFELTGPLVHKVEHVQEEEHKVPECNSGPLLNLKHVSSIDAVNLSSDHKKNEINLVPTSLQTTTSPEKVFERESGNGGVIGLPLKKDCVFQNSGEITKLKSLGSSQSSTELLSNPRTATLSEQYLQVMQSKGDDASSKIVAVSASLQGESLHSSEGQQTENAKPSVECVNSGSLFRPDNVHSAEENKNETVKAKQASERRPQENIPTEYDKSRKKQKTKEPVIVDKQVDEICFAQPDCGIESLSPPNRNSTKGFLQEEECSGSLSVANQASSNNRTLKSSFLKHIEKTESKNMEEKECRPRKELEDEVGTMKSGGSTVSKFVYETHKHTEGTAVERVTPECRSDISSYGIQGCATQKYDPVEEKRNKSATSEMKHTNEGNDLSPKSVCPQVTSNTVSCSLSEVLSGPLTSDAAQYLTCKTTSAVEVSTFPKEIKPKMLSLEQYRQRMQQRKPADDDSKKDCTSRKSKWPVIPELPDGLAEIPCLTVPRSNAKIVPTKVVQTKDVHKSQKCSAVPEDGPKGLRTEDKRGSQKCASLIVSCPTTITTKQVRPEDKKGSQKCPSVTESGAGPTKQIKADDRNGSPKCLSVPECGIVSAKQIGANDKIGSQKPYLIDMSAHTFEPGAVPSFETGVSSAQIVANMFCQVPQKQSSDLFHQPPDSHSSTPISTNPVPCVPSIHQSVHFPGQGAPVHPVGYAYPSSGTPTAASYLTAPQSAPPCNVPPPVWPGIPPPGYQGLPPPTVNANAYPYSSYQSTSVAPLQTPSWPSGGPMIYDPGLGTAVPQTGHAPYTQPFWPSVPMPSQNPVDFFMPSPQSNLVQKAAIPFLSGRGQSFVNPTTVLDSKPLHSCWSDSGVIAPGISTQEQVSIQKMPESTSVLNKSVSTEKRELEQVVQVRNHECSTEVNNQHEPKVSYSWKHFAFDKTIETKSGIKNEPEVKVLAAQETACEVQAEIPTVSTEAKLDVLCKSKVSVSGVETKTLDSVNTAASLVEVLEFESPTSKHQNTDTAFPIGNISNDPSELATRNTPELRDHLGKSCSLSENQAALTQKISSHSLISENVTDDLKCLEVKLNDDAKQSSAFVAVSKMEKGLLLEGKSLPGNVSGSVSSGSSDRRVTLVLDQHTLKMCQTVETGALSLKLPSHVQQDQTQFSPEKCKSVRSSKAYKAANRGQSSAVRKMNLVKTPAVVHGGIEATDVTSLLEQFEESQAEEQKQAPNPDRLAVENSGLEVQSEKKHLDRVLGPELASTAGLTPPATPPHQAWKPLVPVSLLGKQMSPSRVPQEEMEACVSKSIKVESRTFVQATDLKSASSPDLSLKNTGCLDVQVGFGDHDYCLRSNPKEATSQSSSLSTVVQVLPWPRQSPPDKGSRWNVKHCQVITIKPIGTVDGHTHSVIGGQQSAERLSAFDAGKQSTEVIPQADGCVRNTCKDSLDYRTRERNCFDTLGDTDNSVTCSDISSCRKDPETSRNQKRCTPPSKRAMRCYRRQRTPSPEESYRKSRKSRSPRRRRRTSSHSSDSSHSSTSSSSERSSCSRSPPAKRRRRQKRYRSRSSEYSSRSFSRSSSRSRSSLSRESYSRSRSRSWSLSRSRSPSPYRSRGRRRDYRRYDDYGSWDGSCQRSRIQQKQRAIEERRVIYIGKIHNGMTRAELKERFSVFGEIEECTLHFREESDNYGFVTYFNTKDAFKAIENGHKLRLPNELGFDLCFGGRRQFCKSTYADLDRNRDDFDPVPVRSKFDSLDFDTLLRQAQRSIRR